MDELTPSQQQHRQIIHELRAVIHRSRQEYDFTYVDIIGALESVKLDMWLEATVEFQTEKNAD